MSTSKEKLNRFIAMRQRNYRASLKLEGFDVDALDETGNDEAANKSEEALIIQLKKVYAR
ncbi:YhfG family protein [Photobacterium sp. 1_MG-2023]|uniref:YhfG family protein n=1 Tax=Photobacterium sp. 1_MG-2023 TaxID=3062646 RepID=UPI0026E3A6A1|nr:YhfG family protein [Photobacterium sp. 1_MG-2023]MDO6707015.1 DUF2559 family protein [Photobacterium sp. 1_MG-2023]